MLKLNNLSHGKYLILVFLFSIFYRFLILARDKSLKLFFLGDYNTYYGSSLKNHFFDLILNEHTKPPIFLIRDLLALYITPNNYTFWNYLELSILDSIACVLLFNIICKFNKNMTIVFVSVILYSFSLVIWEKWRESSHYDHLNIFFIILHLHSVLLFKGNKKYFCYLLISSILLTLQTTLGIFFVITLLILTYKRYFKLSAYILACSLLSFILISTKNIYKYNIPYPSTVGGQNKLQLVSMLYSNDVLLNEIKKEKYPQWYRSCFLDSYDNKNLYKSLYGPCLSINSSDFSEVKGYLFKLYKSTSDQNLKRYIIDDINLISKKPWILSSGVNESKLNVLVYYGTISNSIANNIIISQPLIFLKGALIIFIKSQIRSSFFFTGLFYEPQNFKGANYLKLPGVLISPLLILGFILSLFILIYFSLSELKIFNTKKLFRFKLNRFLICISFIVFIYSFLYSISTCCENERMLVILTPFSLTITLFFLQKLEKYLYLRQEFLNFFKFFNS